MAWPEGFSGLRIAGAKKVRLLGEGELPTESQEEHAPDEATHVKSSAPQVQYPLRKESGNRGVQYLGSTNIFGLTSRSEQFFPEAYKPISSEYWQKLSTAKRNELISQQAQIMEKVSFRDSKAVHIATNKAEAAYDDALTRRNVAMRRRRKKTGYEGRKQEEEERRKAPLVRRYIARDSAFEYSSFFKASTLEAPVFIPGMVRIRKDRDKRRRKKRGDVVTTEATVPKPVPKLPVIDTRGAEKVGIESWNNRFGLKSRPMTAYPEAYEKVPKLFWRTVDKEHRKRVVLMQAVAMEKVGFEPRTHKQFIEDFNPMMENIYSNAPVQDRIEQNPHPPASFFIGIAVVVVGIVLCFMDMPAWIPAVYTRWPFHPAGFTIAIGVLMMLWWRKDRTR